MSNTINISQKITTLRKSQKWSQAELAQRIKASREIIGKYERGENMPFLEMTLKIADVFNVTVDYFLGKEEYASYDKKTVERLNNIEKMDDRTKDILFDVIDTYIQNFKTKQAFA